MKNYAFTDNTWNIAVLDTLIWNNSSHQSYFLTPTTRLIGVKEQERERERERERESLGEQFDMYTVFRCKKAECKESWERQRKRLEESDWKISLSFDF